MVKNDVILSVMAVVDMEEVSKVEEEVFGRILTKLDLGGGGGLSG